MTEKTPEAVSEKSKEQKKTTMKFDIEVGCERLDATIEKANRLVELLREAQQLISSLSTKI